VAGDVRVVDLFRHEEEGKEARTLTFELAWSNIEGTHTTEELNEATEAWIGTVERELGPLGVHLR
jgi:phenylalanyl-tRNA synthetase beta subunit